MTICVIELKNSDTACYGDITMRRAPTGTTLSRRSFVASSPNSSSQPDDIVEIRRGPTLCFKQYCAQQWAKFDVVDDPRDGLVHHPDHASPHVAAAKAPQITGGGLRHERAAGPAG
jgi:hypothetical protein